MEQVEGEVVTVAQVMCGALAGEVEELDFEWESSRDLM